MELDDYKERIVDKLLNEKLKNVGAILIEGPKWCGKTTTGEHIAKSILYMNDPKNMQNNLMLADADPAVLLKGQTPRLIDEWQLAPKLWDAIRFEADHKKAFGQFILTGSSLPTDQSKITHSGTGRFSRIKMRTMSLQESKESTGEISLKKLFNEQESIYSKTN